MTDLYDFQAAVSVMRAAAESQRAAEQVVRDTSKDLAEKERLYRVALARRIVELHAEGIAWSSTADLARGDERVAMLRYERDVSAGVKDAADQRAWRETANRKDVLAQVEWSMRVHGQDDGAPQPRWQGTGVGERAA